MRLRAHTHTETWETQLQPRIGQPVVSLTVSATSERTEDGEVLYWVLHHLIERSLEKPPPAAPVQGRTAAVRGVTPPIQVEIEERRRAEAALRESEKRYRDLFENANDMMTTIALDGTFLAVNRKTEQLLGYSREELIGQDSHKLS
jgi:PAS domain-containing protein